MRRRVRVPSIFVLALALSSAATAEEQADGVPAHSFSELRTVLTSGERLIVRDSTGRDIEGLFGSLSGNELEITHKKSWDFRSGVDRTEQLVFSEGAVVRIQRKDPTWDGSVIGGVIGVLAIVIMVKAQCSEICLPFLPAAVPAGWLIGEAIDGSINRTVYELSPVVGRVVPPLGGPHHRLALSYRFSITH